MNDDVENVDVLLLKTNQNGNQEWIRTYGGPAWDIGYSADQTTDGGYMITGYTDSFGAGDHDVWVITTDSVGTEKWDLTFGGSSEDVGYSGQQTTDGGYIITGSTASYGAGLTDLWLIKIKKEDNQPPFPPSITGKLIGKVGEDNYYTFQTTDPDDDSVYFWVEWGDGGQTGWIGPYASNEQEILTHVWNKTGAYAIRAKAKDTFGAESEWSTLSIIMPTEYRFSLQVLLQYFLEMHPHAFPFLRYLLGY
jgi:hypothetical protein